MTVENLHDAIGRLPSDLVAETDRRRSRPRKVIPWKRYAAMAACLALMLFAGRYCLLLFAPKGSGAAMDMIAEAPAAAAPREEAQAAEGWDCPAEEAPSAVRESEAVPKLTVSSEEESLTLLFFSCDWTIPQGDNSSMSILSDTAPATEQQDLPLIETDRGSLLLEPEAEPDRVSYRCWREEEGQWVPALINEWNDLAVDAEGGYTLTLQKGLCLYEIILNAPQGRISYAFRAAG